MSKVSIRMRKISELVHTQLATILRQSAEDERLKKVTITDVEVSKDLSVAKVYFTIRNPEEKDQTQDALKKSGKFLRYLLAQEVELRRMPELVFIFDNSAAKGNRIDALLNKAMKDIDTDQ